MQDVNKDVSECNTEKTRKRLIAFDNMIAVILNKLKFNQTVTNLFIRRRKLNNSAVFMFLSHYLT